MFRMWCKIFSENHMIKDLVIEDNSDLNRTKKVLEGLTSCCYQFDLSVPVWLEANIKDFKRHDKTRFTQDSFIEHINFDYLEIQVIEED